ncbi:helix-turn-helix domain-containing protein [Bifidobacterium bombi]|uniref:Cro/C1-type HTH DNA-binding domain n=1 Tax=Bifidobacterium bombi DSM 19703 TaxID=1341695 RepID=A0A080N3Q8_9BIFI|nr:Cro/C1-type HTH DNA-binding domain [Bifidobacterium bombi DSM 19703]
MITNTSTDTWLGQKVQSVIASSGIKKTAVAEKTGMPYSTLNSKLRGYSSFTFDDIIRIAQVLKCDPCVFLPPSFRQSGMVQKVAA